jgi:hypothetical protein
MMVAINVIKMTLNHRFKRVKKTHGERIMLQAKDAMASIAPVMDNQNEKIARSLVVTFLERT